MDPTVPARKPRIIGICDGLIRLIFTTRKMRALRDMMAGADGFEVERIFLSNQRTIRALIDTDGAKLIASSAGFKAIWNEFAQLEGMHLEDKLLNEIKSVVEDASIKAEILRGS